MTENIGLKKLQNGMKKMLEVVEQIRVDDKKRKYRKTTCKTGSHDCGFVRKTKTRWFELRQRSSVQPTISNQKHQARLFSRFYGSEVL